MPCRLFGAKSLSKPMLSYCQLDPQNKFQWHLIEIHKLSLSKMHPKISSAKWRPFRLGGDGLMSVIQKIMKSRKTETVARWHHQMVDSFALLSLCAVNPPGTGEIPLQRAITVDYEVFCLAKEVGREHGKCERPSMRQCVRSSVNASIRPGFPTIVISIVRKSNQSIHCKFAVGIYWVSVQNRFAFRWRWPNFGPLVAPKRQEMGQNGSFLPLSEKDITHSNSNLWRTLDGWVFWNDSLCWVVLAQFWPSSGQKWLIVGHNCGFRPLSKKYSHNPIQTWCVHLLGECSEMICLLATLPIFWPSSGH